MGQCQSAPIRAVALGTRKPTVELSQSATLTRPKRTGNHGAQREDPDAQIQANSATSALSAAAFCRAKGELSEL